MATNKAVARAAAVAATMGPTLEEPLSFTFSAAETRGQFISNLEMMLKWHYCASWSILSTVRPISKETCELAAPHMHPPLFQLRATSQHSASLLPGLQFTI